MRTLFFSLLLFACSLCPSLASANDQRESRPDIAGYYYLSGMREVGSELHLRKNGEFNWALMYGAVDLYARGNWKREGKFVTLTSTRPSKGKFRLFEESELNLQKDARAGVWVAIVGVPRTGPVPNIEVRFVAKSGKSATAVSMNNGDAIVQMPSSERWVRTGLKRAGSNDEWQWIDVTDVRASARIAGFAVLNWQQISPPPFKLMKLRIEGEELSIDENPMGMRGTYSKPDATSDASRLIHCGLDDTAARPATPDLTCLNPFFPVYGRSPPTYLAALP